MSALGSLTHIILPHFSHCRYNCENAVELYEQFIRQAMLMKSEPIVIFSHSATENWNKDQCAVSPPPHVLSPAEVNLVSLFRKHQSREIFTSVNKISRTFPPVELLSEMYKVCSFV